MIKASSRSAVSRGRTFTRLSAARLIAALIFFPALCAAAIIEPPVVTPDGDTGFVGSVSVTFKAGAILNGKIIYTLDGTTPTLKNGTEWNNNPFPIAKTTTLKAIHVRSGMVSDVVTAVFTQERVPAPIAKYGGKLAFYPTVTCTLQVAGVPGALIKYTSDGTPPNSTSLDYGSPQTFSKNTTLRAYGTATGYEDGDTITLPFTVAQAPAAPVATPGGQAFSGPLTVKLKSATDGAVVRYATDASVTNLATAAIVADSTILISGKNSGDTVTLRAQAFQAGHPASAVLTEKYVYLPPVATPTASRPSGYFYDTATIALNCATPNAIIHYTDNGNSPTLANSKTYAGPFSISSSTTIRAFATYGASPQSGTLLASYNLNLSPPSISAPSGEFSDSIRVRINSACPNASLLYTLDGSPVTRTSSHAGQDTTLTVAAAGTTILSVMAVKDADSSAVASRTYVKTAHVAQLSTPIIAPDSRSYQDSLLVTITAPDSSDVYYTLDGVNPTKQDSLYKGPFYIYTATDLRAKAFPAKGTSLTASSIVEQTYLLTPSQPIASPSPAVKYTGSVRVTLSTHTRGGIIKYTLGDAAFDAAKALTYSDTTRIVLTKPTRVQAQTQLASGTNILSSPLLTAQYDVSPANTDTLAAGAAQPLSAGYTFTNTGSAPVVARVHTTDSFFIVGFRDASLALTLKAVPPGNVHVTFSKSAGATGSLYRYSDSTVEFISSDSQTDLTQPGEYFVGTDTMPPVITLIDQPPKVDDSTVVKLKVTDNVKGPSCEIESPGIPGGRQTMRPNDSGYVFATLKNPGSDPKDLWMRATAKDFYNSSSLPKDADGKIDLAQIWSHLLTPSVLSLGHNGAPWDMAGLPVSGNTPVTWGKIRNDNASAGLSAEYYNLSDGQYYPVDDSTVVTPGAALWVTSSAPRSSLTLTQFRAAESESDGSYKMTLHTGWNMVTDPSLERLYWPVSPKDANFSQSKLKGLFSYNQTTGGYDRSDSLDAWKGCFVYYFGDGGDTLIKLYPFPPAKKAAKVSAEAPGMGLSLAYGRALPLQLGASASAQDGVGSEDEPQLPSAWGARQLWLQRGSRRLMSDQVRFVPGAVLRWKIVLDAAARNSGAEDKLRVQGALLPAGYQVWAVSESRHMRFPLAEGADVPVSASAGDTLSVLAGPLGKLSATPEFARSVLAVEKFVFSLETDRGMNILHLALPDAADVEAEVWSLTGQSLARIRPGRLAGGLYSLPLGRGVNAQLGFLRLRVKTEKGAQEYSQKVVW